MSISQVGLPKELSKDMEYQLPAGLSSYPVRVVPSNIQSITTGSLPALSGTSTPVSLSFPATPVIFDIPANGGKSVFIDHRYSTLSFRVNYEVVSVGTAQTMGTSYLRSNAQSWVERATTFGQSGIVLDDINNFGLVADTLLQLEMDVAQRDCLSSMYGLLAEASSTSALNANQGHSIAGWSGTLSAGSNYYSYCVPLMNSVFGVDAKKFFNIGATSKLQLQLTTPSIAPITLATGSTGSGGVLKITIDRIQLNLQYIDVGQDGLKMMSNGGLQYYPATTYRVSNVSLPAGSGGQISLLTSIKGSSIRNIICRVNETPLSAVGSLNERYDAKSLLSVSTAFNINGMRVPSFPIDQVHDLALSFSTLQECNASFTPREMKSSITPDRFGVYVASTNVPTDADELLATTNSSAGTLASSFFGYNFEKISKAGLLDGINMNGANSYIEYNTGSSTTSNACVVYFVAKMDIIYVLDTATGEVSVRM